MTSLGIIPEKVITTVSRFNGVQVTIEAKCGETWHYIAFGINNGVDVVYSHATPDDVTATLRSLASTTGMEPVRYAAGNRTTGNFHTILDTQEGPS